jgi:predicted aspartyl protease
VTGFVNARGLSIVHVTFHHPQLSFRLDLDAMVDTACEVDAVLSSLDVAALALPYLRSQQVVFGDGRMGLVKVYEGVIEWFGAHRPIQVSESNRGLPLLGAPLLTPRTLTIDYAQRTVDIR